MPPFPLIPKVFVSHSSADRLVIELSILPLLRSHGLEYWYSSESIPSASDWEKVIRCALTECDWFLVALSASSMRSDWVQAEVHWALDHRKERFVSLLLDDCTPSDLHLKLIRYQHVDFRQPGDDPARRLIEAFGCGYQYIPSLRLEYRSSWLGGQICTLNIHETAFIGRASDSDILVPDPGISRRHCLLKVRTQDGKSTLWLSDLGSGSGTRINGSVVAGLRQLEEGDCITIGDSEIHVLAAMGR